MYTDRNFKSKKLLKDAVKAFNAGTGPAVTYHQPGPFGGNEPKNGYVVIEGPQFPQAHTWYAKCDVKNGHIIKVS